MLPLASCVISCKPNFRTSVKWRRTLEHERKRDVFLAQCLLLSELEDSLGTTQKMEMGYWRVPNTLLCVCTSVSMWCYLYVCICLYAHNGHKNAQRSKEDIWCPTLSLSSLFSCDRTFHRLCSFAGIQQAPASFCAHPHSSGVTSTHSQASLVCSRVPRIGIQVLMLVEQVLLPTEPSLLPLRRLS